MAQLNAGRRRSNLVILVTLKKGNPPGEAYVGRNQKKALYRKHNYSLEGPNEEAEIPREALRRGKNLAINEATYLKKEIVRSKVTPRKV